MSGKCRLLLAALTLTSLLPLTAFAEEETNSAAEAAESYSLDISEANGQWIYIDESPVSERGEPVLNEDGSPKMAPVPACYALMDQVYVASPENPAVQQMDIYVPAAYVDAVANEDGTYTVSWNTDAEITSGSGAVYTASTAPVIYQNTVNGYMQGNSFNLGDSRNGTGSYSDFIQSGYILVSIGTRGLQGDTEDGSAPVQLVDLKAGIRFLRKNADYLPGDYNKIIATGASAGGAVSALLGVSGNSALYDSYLNEIGAVEEKDDIYGALVFCPITNLDYGDAAYEWQHSAELEAIAGWESQEKVTFSEFETALHEALIERYKENLSSFGLDPDEFESTCLQAINDCIADYTANLSEEELSAFLSDNSFLLVNEESGLPEASSVGSYMEAKAARMGAPTGFDGLEKNKTENNLFQGKHFDAELLAVLESLSEEFPEAAEAAKDYAADIDEEQKALVKLMSPMTFLLGEEEGTIAPHWRINNGGNDGNLGFVSGLTIVETLKAKNLAEDAQFNLIWDKGHMAADYSYADAEAWIDRICGE